jgi:hypothetical protein
MGEHLHREVAFLTHEDIHLFVHVVVEQQVVAHAHAMRLHRVSWRIVIIPDFR